MDRPTHRAFSGLQFVWSGTPTFTFGSIFFTYFIRLCWWYQ